MHCYPTLNCGKTCLSSAPPLLLGKLKLFQDQRFLPISPYAGTEGTNNLYDNISADKGCPKNGLTVLGLEALDPWGLN